MVFGATGYIGKQVTLEMMARGYNVTAVTRTQSGIGGKQAADDVRKMFDGATVKFADVTDADSVRKSALDGPVDVVVSCLASRTGGIQDSWDIDYQVCPFLLPLAAATIVTRCHYGHQLPP